MITASEAIMTAIGFLGFGSLGLGAERPAPAIEPSPVLDEATPPSVDLLSRGEPYFEEVAAALRRTGYLDA